MGREEDNRDEGRSGVRDAVLGATQGRDAGALLTTAEVADRLRVSQKAVHRLIARGALRAHRPVKREYAVRASDLDAYMEARRAAAREGRHRGALPTFMGGGYPQWRGDLPAGFVGTSAVARTLGITPQGVQYLMGRGYFPNAQKMNGLWAIPQADMDAYLERRHEERSHGERPQRAQAD